MTPCRTIFLLAVVMVTGCAQTDKKPTEPVPQGPPGDVQVPLHAVPGKQDLANIHEPYLKNQWESVVQKWNHYYDEQRAEATWLSEYRVGYAADQAYRKTSEDVYLKIACDRYEAAARKCPTFAPYYLLRAGWLSSKAKQRETARRYFDSVLRIEPDNLSAILWAGWMAYLIEPGTVESIDLLSRWLKRAPPDDGQRRRIAFAVARSCAIRGDIKQAEKVVAVERARAPKDKGYLYDLDLAEILARYKHQARAMRLARLVLAGLDPNLPDEKRQPILERIRKINEAQVSAAPEASDMPSADTTPTTTQPIATATPTPTPATVPATTVDTETQRQIDALVDKARTFMDNHNYDAALPELRKAYELSPREDIIGRLAVCLALTQKTDEALQILDEGLRQYPGNQVMIKMKTDIENRRDSQ